MNPIISTLILFSAIFLVFFGAPIILLSVTSWFFPPENTTTTLNPIVLPEYIVSIKKVIHKGKVLWVDSDE